MTVRVLVADDSSTIQKVVRITLASTGYQLVEALDENQLFEQLKSGTFDLVLVDFNLSDEKSGYQLCSEIASYTSSKIMALLGAFDSVDEQELQESGVFDKIIKPFDSVNFVNKCRYLIESDAPQAKKVEDVKTQAQAPAQDDEFIFSEEKSNDISGWTMDRPPVASAQLSSLDELEDLPVEKPEAILADKMNEWGMEIPAKLDGSGNEDFEIVPPQIDELEFDDAPEMKEEEEKFVEPPSSDLAYPDIMDSSDFTAYEQPKTTNSEISFELQDLSSTPSDFTFEVPEAINLSLENEINKEQSPDDFWKAEPNSASEVESISIPSAQLNDLEYTIDMPKSAPTEIDYDLLVEKLKDAILPRLEVIMRDECRKLVREVAWDTVPDLAENLIKKELSEIKKSVYKE